MTVFSKPNTRACHVITEKAISKLSHFVTATPRSVTGIQVMVFITQTLQSIACNKFLAQQDHKMKACVLVFSWEPNSWNKNCKLPKVIIIALLWGRLRNSKTSSTSLSDHSPLALQTVEVGQAGGGRENFFEFVSAAENWLIQGHTPCWGPRPRLADVGVWRASSLGTTLKATEALELSVGLAEAVTGPLSCSASPAVRLPAPISSLP